MNTLQWSHLVRTLQIYFYTTNCVKVTFLQGVSAPCPQSRLLHLWSQPWRRERSRAPETENKWVGEGSIYLGSGALGLGLGDCLTSVGGGGPLPAASVGCERCSWCFSCRSTQVPLCETSQPATILWVWVMRSPPCYSSRDTTSESPYFIILFFLTTSFLLSFELCRLAGTFNSN